MQDALDQLTLYLKSAWVNKWIGLIIAWTICLIGWAFVLKMPDNYNSEAKVYVDTQSLLSPLLRGLTIQTDPNRQVELIVKTLFTRPSLENIARLADLDIRARDEAEFERLISRLSSNLELDRAGRDNIYSISYESSSATEAKNVVQATLTSLVENTLGDKRQDSNTATAFLDRQIAEYERRLSQADNELKEFKKNNYDLMGAGGDYYGRIESLRTNIQTINLQLREALARRDSIKRQVVGEAPSFGIMDEQLTDAASSEVTTGYDSRIAALETKLDELRLQYTDLHPDIRQAERILDDLIEKRDVELNARKTALENTPFEERADVNRNPVYQQLKIALAQEDTNVQSLKARLSDYREQLAALEQKINTIPEIEAELKALQRGYSVTQQKHNELLQRREQARLSQEADISANNFQIRVIDPPRLPQEPSGPNRPLFLTGILGTGLAAGFGMAFLMGQIKPVFSSSGQLGAVTGLPILGSVTYVDDGDEVKRKRKRMMLFISGLLVLGGLYGLLILLQLFPDINQGLINLLPDLPSRVSEWLPAVRQSAQNLINLF